MVLTLTVNGACGRMGRALMELALAAPGLSLASLWGRAGASDGVFDARPGLPAVTEQWVSKSGDVVVDFSRTEGLRSLLKNWPDDNNSALVSGTTGLDDELLELLGRRAERSPVFYAANMSQGAHALRMLARRAAELLDSEWDVELVEMHHNRKADAPSGTATALIETGSRAPSSDCLSRIADALELFVGGELYMGPDNTLYGMIDELQSAGFVELRATF